MLGLQACNSTSGSVILEIKSRALCMLGRDSTITSSGSPSWLFLQIDAASLIAASVMAAPCALALSKLVYPEVEESKFRSEEGVKLTYG